MVLLGDFRRFFDMADLKEDLKNEKDSTNVKISARLNVYEL